MSDIKFKRYNGQSGVMAPSFMIFTVLVFSTIPLSESLALIHSGTPSNVPNSTDCALRALAWDQGKKLLPERGVFKSLFDALQLGSCPNNMEEDEVWTEPSGMDEWRPQTFSTCPSALKKHTLEPQALILYPTLHLPPAGLFLHLSRLMRTIQSYL